MKERISKEVWELSVHCAVFLEMNCWSQVCCQQGEAQQGHGDVGWLLLACPA